jgi:alpha-glucosidase (family GH31 glycosyl hydrolase)
LYRFTLPTASGVPLAEPYCYFTDNYVGYKVSQVNSSDDEMHFILTRESQSSFEDVNTLHVAVSEFDQMVSVVISKHKQPNTILPPLNLKHLKKRTASDSLPYTVNLSSGVLSVNRVETGDLIWSANLQTMIYAKDFRQLDTHVPTEALYGLGERMDSFQKTDFSYNRYTFFNRDRVPWWKLNLYGSHPTYLMLESNGQAHQTLFYNQYPAEAILRPGKAITWRALGGPLTFYIFAADSAKQATEVYTRAVGLPVLPPVWAFGFQLCRYGYNSLDETRAVYQRMRDAKIPYDVQWNDIDVMDADNDFTYDPVAFEGLPDFVKELHDNDMHYVTMLDPGLDGTYLNGNKYDGFTTDVVIQNPNGSPLRGKVWNRNWTAWIDFTSDAGIDFWNNQIQSFYKQIPFDGLWIDMNDPSNEVDGSLDGCLGNSHDNPIYLPGDDINPIYKKTVCMSAKHAVGDHMKVHNMYGNFETMATYRLVCGGFGTRPSDLFARHSLIPFFSYTCAEH